MKITSIDDFEVFKERFIEECKNTGVLDPTNKDELITVRDAAQAVLEGRYKTGTGEIFYDIIEAFKAAHFAFVNELTDETYVIYKDKYGHTAVLKNKCTLPPLNGMIPSYFHFLRFNDDDTSKYVQVVTGVNGARPFTEVLKECVLENINKILKEEL